MMIAVMQEKFDRLSCMMNEKLKRHWAACEAMAMGRGGISAVAKATGISPNTIRKGIREIQTEIPHLAEEMEHRVRQPGGGRRRLSEKDESLIQDLEKLLESTTRGDPMSPLLWTCKSTRKLAEELQKQGHQVSHMTVDRLLGEMDYSLQGNRKTKEGKQHPDRDAQFQFIAKQVRRFQRRRQPVISVDTKKKELVGDFKKAGREWRKKGDPEKVRVHDFRDKELGVAIPYGVYDMTRNQGWVNVGIDHDTAQFAVSTIRSWWSRMGRKVYPDATELLITADGGGSNGHRSRLWKVCIQRLADQTGLHISVCHFPPGTSKWNKIEHRMFCHITENWRGKPLLSRAVVVNLIGNTTTRKGLQIHAELDEGTYETGIKVSDEEMARLNIRKNKFHGDWNYTISPSAK
jgi:transposase